MPPHSHTTDEGELLLRLREGDQAAFKEVYYRHFPLLTAVAKHITRDTAAAEDVAQATLISFWNKREDILVQTSLSSYLKQMAVREAIGQKRKETHRQELLEARPDISVSEAFVDTSVEFNEVYESVEQAVDALPEKCQEVFRLSRMEGLTYREIAESMNISIKTVENQMGRALKHLRRSLREFINMLW